jgi:hypothetical protein
MVFERIVSYVPFAIGIVTCPLAAQSARPISVQASYLRVSIFGGSLGGVTAANGFEGQLRYTKGRWSVGGGMEYSKHAIDGAPSGYGLRRVGPFVEPRFLLPTSSNTIAPYIAGRLSIVSVTALVPSSATNVAGGSSTGTTLNAGGGLLIRMAPRVNLDVGISGGYSSYGSVKFPSGTTSGSLGTGGNFIIRAGFSLGL